MEVRLTDEAKRPKREGAAPKPGIAHLGPGAFFRAFNAIYTEEAIAAAGGDWGILAISLRSSKLREQLLPQGCAYTAVSLSPMGPEPQIINSVVDVMAAGDDASREAIIEAMAAPNIRIITLTITEKGYGYSHAKGGLDKEQPDIAADLRDPNWPRSAVGFLVASLELRRQSGGGPVTILSCDNMPSNGKVTKTVVLEFANAAKLTELASWIEDNVAFPSSMVDRITPATSDEDVDWLASHCGYFDPACVMHEPFRQWVIEDNFAAGRPAWDAVGAQFVNDVHAHEVLKLRCLNGTHSALAYLGYLAGYESISDTVADAPFAALCTRLWEDEILPTVTQPEGEDVGAYCAALLERYRNPSIHHRTWQIAMDGSQKLPQRILATVKDAAAAGRATPGLNLVVAAWMRYVGGVDERGQDIDVRDPLAKRLRQISDDAANPAEAVSALLSMQEVFEPALATNLEFKSGVTAALEQIITQGAHAAVEAYVSGRG